MVAIVPHDARSANIVLPARTHRSCDNSALSPAAASRLKESIGMLDSALHSVGV